MTVLLKKKRAQGVLKAFLAICEELVIFLCCINNNINYLYKYYLCNYINTNIYIILIAIIIIIY